MMVIRSLYQNKIQLKTLVEDSATVKTFYKEKNFYRLQPENDSMEPILVKEVTILGKVIGLFRFM